MSETARIVDQLHRAYHGPAWHGPALGEILAGVTAEMAALRPLPGAHTIWEIVLHIAVWEVAVTRRLQGEEIPKLMPEQDWPAVHETNEAAWQRALDALLEAQVNLEARIARMEDARLSEKVLGARPYSIYTMLHGVVQHNLYHAGQIALLKRAGA
jgi:uncharacterized damage-inducible protein DinB